MPNITCPIFLLSILSNNIIVEEIYTHIHKIGFFNSKNSLVCIYAHIYI